MKKRSAAIIAAVLLILAAAIGVLVWINGQENAGRSVERGNLAVTKDGETLAVFTLEDLKAMEAVEVEKTITSASEEDVTGVFRGPSVQTVIDAADSTALDGAAQVLARSEDGFVMGFSVDEVRQGDNIFIACSQDGEDLKSMDEGGAGPLRIVVQADSFGNRSAKYLCELEVE